MALRQALAARLGEAPAVRQAFGTPPRLFDERRREAVFPYLSWAKWEVRPGSAGELELLDVRALLHVWSRDGDALELTARVRSALRGAPPALDGGWHVVRGEPVFSDVLRLRNNRQWRGVIRYAAMLEKRDEEGIR